MFYLKKNTQLGKFNIKVNATLIEQKCILFFYPKYVLY